MTYVLEELLLEEELYHPILCKPHKIIRLTRKSGRTSYVIYLDEDKRELWEAAIKKGIKFKVVLIPVHPSQEGK